MQIVKFLERIMLTAGAALVALFMALTAPNSSAGLFDVPSEPADWNGMYVAFRAGGAISNYDISGYNTTLNLTRQYNEAVRAIPPGAGTPVAVTGVNLATFAEDGHSSSDGNGMGGVDLGYNKQIGHWVLGGGFGFSGTETDDASEARDAQLNVIATSGNFGTAATDFHSFRRVEQIWSGYVGGQVGYAWNRWLFYATGGTAFTQIDLRTLDRATTAFENLVTPPAVVAVLPPVLVPVGSHTDKIISAFNTVQVGWYAGCGFQYAFNNAVSAGLEYRHADFGDTTYHIPRQGNKDNAVFPGGTSVDVDNNELYFKVTILLGNLGEKKVVETPMPKK